MNSIPEIRKLAKQTLTEKGFQYPKQDGKTLFVYRELDVHRLCFDFTLTNYRDNNLIECSCTFISNDLGESINYLSEEKHRVFPQNSLNSKEWGKKEVSESTIEKLISNISREALEFSNSSSFLARLKDILSTIDRPGSHQLWHLAALATTKDIKQLTKLLKGLSSINRGGLWPYITDEYISRAIAYAKRKNA